ncbi:peptidase M2 family peptidase [Microlunatus phosphovorus NM-1]|uniref:Peptidase M2 family peptidase n=1 Tax=Microlunatus phosphovorus (strain ATCC 700054 / DSM 10555 / JCM 9379 / NBRC 101784 / NCIMB 13414 / VKM Ac-1990 / NM-1) TaxID=1032480 RepID=F5XMI5_MICPN|nr:peptidase M2 family peptidase [Microlunatus phosphovorus NM-1]
MPIEFPFRGRWQARNSPARRVPSHGTHRFGVTYAIDFVAVDDRGRSAVRSWRTLLSAEPPEIFRGFGAAILAPVAGTVVLAHDGEGRS